MGLHSKRMELLGPIHDKRRAKSVGKSSGVVQVHYIQETCHLTFPPKSCVQPGLSCTSALKESRGRHNWENPPMDTVFGVGDTC